MSIKTYLMNVYPFAYKIRFAKLDMLLSSLVLEYG